MLEQVMADNGFPVPLVEGGGCRVFQFHSDTGEGIMTQYDLFPGVSLMYNDFHMESYDSAFHTTEDMLCIDYCRQGRMEYPAGRMPTLCGGGRPETGPPAGAPGPLYLPSCPLPRHYHRLHPAPGRPIPEGVGAGVPGGSGAAPGEVLRRPPPQGDPRGRPLWTTSSRSSMRCRSRSNCPTSASRCWNCCCTWTPWNWKGCGEALLLQIPGGKGKGCPPLIDRGAGAALYHCGTLRTVFCPGHGLKECFKSVYGQPVNTYMRNFRMDRAALLLRQEPQRPAWRRSPDGWAMTAPANLPPCSRRSRARRLWNTGGKGGKFFRPNGTRPAGRSGRGRRISYNRCS